MASSGSGPRLRWDSARHWLELPLWVAIGLGAPVLVLLAWRLPTLNRDGAWFAVLVAACLLSPIAWLYYALPLLGPAGLTYQQGDRWTRYRYPVGVRVLVACVAATEPEADQTLVFEYLSISQTVIRRV